MPPRERQTGENLSAADLSSGLKKVCSPLVVLTLPKKARIENYVWYSNSHTFCSWLAAAGASPREIMEASGRKTITTAARYSHQSPEHTMSLVERVME